MQEGANLGAGEVGFVLAAMDLAKAEHPNGCRLRHWRTQDKVVGNGRRATREREREREIM